MAMIFFIVLIFYKGNQRFLGLVIFGSIKPDLGFDTFICPFFPTVGPMSEKEGQEFFLWQPEKRSPPKRSIPKNRCIFVTLSMKIDLLNEWQQLWDHPEARKWLHESTTYNEKLAFQMPKSANFNKVFLLEQLELRDKAKKKLPSWNHPQHLFSRIPLEQCTSEALALWKKKYFSGDFLIDLTGGMGVDVWSMSGSFEKSWVFEQNEERARLLRHNLALLGREHVSVFPQSAVAEELPACDLIYVDPDRRVTDQRTFSLEDSEPQVFNLLAVWLQKAKKVVVKASPMIPLQESMACFPVPPKTVIALGDATELKEILFVFEPHFEGSPEFLVVAKDWDETQSMDFSEGKEGRFLWDPHPGYHKLGSAQKVATKYGGVAENDGGHYYAFSYFFPLPGTFHEQVWENRFKEKELKQWMKENGVNRLQIRCRQFFHAPEQIAQKWKIKSGGDFYLWCYQKNGQPWLSVTKYPRF